MYSRNITHWRGGITKFLIHMRGNAWKRLTTTAMSIEKGLCNKDNNNNNSYSNFYSALQDQLHFRALYNQLLSPWSGHNFVRFLCAVIATRRPISAPIVITFSIHASSFFHPARYTYKNHGKTLIQLVSYRSVKRSRVALLSATLEFGHNIFSNGITHVPWIVIL